MNEVNESEVKVSRGLRPRPININGASIVIYSELFKEMQKRKPYNTKY